MGFVLSTVYQSSDDTSLPSSIFTEDVRYRIRIRHMCDTACTKAFQKLLNWLHPKWDQFGNSLADYLEFESNNTEESSQNAPDRGLSKKQKKLLKDLRKPPLRPTDSWDITFLYSIIQWGSTSLGEKNSDEWHKPERPRNLEYLIWTLKDHRNDVMHSHIPLTFAKFKEKTEVIMELLEEMITLAGSKCNISVTDTTIFVKELKGMIDQCKIDDLYPKDYSDYMRQLIFPKLRSFVETEGRKELSEHHRKYKTNVPVSNLVTMKVPVEKVFTKMVLEESNRSIGIEDIFTDGTDSISDQIILIIGDAGVGKTALTKKMLSDWINRKQDIKGLPEFNIVLHAACREHISSIEGLLTYSMPNTSVKVSGEDLVHIVGEMRTLVIMDGLDELNEDSTKLFNMILKLKETYDSVTVLVTTRPEALEKYKKLVNSTSSETKRINLHGIPPEKRNDFVQKYYDGIDKSDMGQQDISELLEYLQSTEIRLGYLWRSPFNITLLVILWIMKPEVVNKITTSPELNWEMFNLYIEKLEERLLKNQKSQGLPLSDLKRNTELFLYALCEEAIAPLARDNEVMLDTQAYNRLEKTCLGLKLPVDEMLGMFLKQTETASGITYSFPHKAVLEFMAARYIFLQLTDTFVNHDLQEITVGMQELFSKHQVYTAQTHGIMNDIKEVLNRHLYERTTGTLQQESTKIKEIIERAEGSQTITLGKYQNVLKCLLGIFYLDKNTVPKSAKEEALNLLEKTGLNNIHKWLDVLDDVKCDEQVASFILHRPGILDKVTRINDNDSQAYVRLLQALDAPISDATMFEIRIDIKRECHVISELANRINMKSLNVTSFVYEHAFRNPSATYTTMLPIKEMVNRCQLQSFVGMYIEDMSLPSGATRPSFSVGSKADYKSLCAQLRNSRDHFTNGLCLCVSSEIEASDLQSIECEGSIYLYLPDASDIIQTAMMVKALCPESGSFCQLYFPRCQISVDEIRLLLQRMVTEGVQVMYGIYLPSTYKCTEEIHEIASEMGAKHGVFSGGVDVQGVFLDDW